MNRSTADDVLAAQVLAVLPQTQCTRCGYPDCAAYAQAIASGDAAINQCPPGGAEGVQRLAKVTGRPELPLNPEFGLEGPRHVAWIDEAWCIGCTLCIKACPVDCIALENVTGEHTGWQAWSSAQAEDARERYASPSARRQRSERAHAERREAKAQDQLPREPEPVQNATPSELERKRAIVEAALARARAKRTPPG